MMIYSRQGLCRNKIINFSEMNSWKYFSESAGPRQHHCKLGGVLGTSRRPPTYRRHLHRNSGECGGPSREGSASEHGIVGSPKFAMLRQGSHEGARIVLVDWNLPEYGLTGLTGYFREEGCYGGAGYFIFQVWSLLAWCAMKHGK